MSVWAAAAARGASEGRATGLQSFWDVGIGISFVAAPMFVRQSHLLPPSPLPSPPNPPVDKNARSKPVKEKAPNPAKWKGGSKVSLKADPNSGAAFEDAKEMYKSSAALQRERDAEAKKNAQAAAKIANRGRKAKKQQQVARAEYEAYNDTEEKREGKFNIRRVDHKPKPKRRVQFVEKPASFNGLQYDATKNKRNNESMVSEPKKVVVDPEDDPALFRQSMESIKLSR